MFHIDYNYSIMLRMQLNNNFNKNNYIIIIYYCVAKPLYK